MADNYKKYFDSLGKSPQVDINIAKNSLEIMKMRHLLKDDEGNLIEEPKDMFWRVARRIASEDANYVNGDYNAKLTKIRNSAHKFVRLLGENRFLPGSRVLYEAGNDKDGTGQLSSCFVLPIEDSLEKIFQTMQEAAIVQKNNGGTGFNFSHIRPKGDEVGGTPNVAAGPIHFIKTFSQAFDNILQGKKRGGGNMAILNINHPDIEEFIELKGTDSSIRNFNISVGVSDKFMEAVKNDASWDLINPRNGEVYKTVRAKALFDRITEKAWECADPGLFFSDTVQRNNPTKPLGIIEATNPCGEEPLRAYESCNLGSIVLTTHLKKVNGEYQIDWDKLGKTAREATHFLDNMIDASKFPLEKIAKEVEKTRKLGLGVVGLGTMFYKMGIGYNSSEAVNLTKKIIGFIQEESTKESEKLAEERGVFPGFPGSKWDKMGRKVRNATMSSIAPTGTLSLVANTSSGVEPIFSLVYKKYNFYQDQGKDNRKAMLYVNDVFEEYAKEKGFYSEEIMEKIAENHGSLKGIEEIPTEAKKIFVTTHDISPDWHVKMQAASQNDVDAAVSKTINLPHNATVADVRAAYIQAWETGCKGITIYRDGSKDNQVLENVSKKEEKREIKIDMPKVDTKDETSKVIAQEFKTDVRVDIDENTLTPNALQVLEKRALLKDDNDNPVESPQELWRRIASHIASAEDSSVRDQVEEDFYNVMNNGEFLSGGTLIWAGMGPETIMSKCLVLPIDDSIDSIMETLNWNIQCLRRGVGTGFNFSKLRSTKARVKTTGELAAGPVEYLRMFNRAQDTIRGRGGRGLGSMAILNADHPDVDEFIKSKDDLTSITHYNISIGASDKFMEAVKNDKEWDLIDPHTKEVVESVPARELFERIAKHAWTSGDPGMFFLDAAEKTNTTPNLGDMYATNPCGEQPLIPFETCNLGHINVSKMINGIPFASDPNIRAKSLEEKFEYIDWNKFRKVIRTAVRFLDDIIEVNNYPIPEIEEMTKKTRNIGVGLMGFADLLVKLGVSYGSKESLEVAKKVMSFIEEESHIMSEELAEEKGSFPAFNESTWFTQGKKGMRNTRVTTIAPTGTISIIADVNPGIEPIFALGYRRKNSMGGTDQEVIEQLFEKVAKERGFHSLDLIHKIADGAHLSEIKDEFGIPDDVVEVFKTTHEIDPESHVRIQAAFQKHTDSAVSKTINLPNSASWRDIARVYQLAWETGCKGITIFRDGSKDPALQVGTKDKKVDDAAANEMPAEAPRQVLEKRKRDHVTHGTTYQVNTEQGKLYITVNEDDQGVCEVFLTIGKSGSFTAGYTEAIGRLISMSLRSGIKAEDVIEELQGIRTSTPSFNKGMIVYSVPDAIAKIIKKHIEESKKQMTLIPNVKVVEEKIEEPKVNGHIEAQMKQVGEAVAKQNKADQVAMENASIQTSSQSIVTTTIETEVQETKIEIPEELAGKNFTAQNTHGDLFECPDCSGDLEYAEGCILCRSCGYSKCG